MLCLVSLVSLAVASPVMSNCGLVGAPIDWVEEAAWRGTRRPLAEATTLTADHYTDDGFFDLEQQRVFARSWVGVGTTDELLSAGGAASDRVLVRSVGSRSVIVTTDKDGGLVAYLNACRHRGTELVAVDGPLGPIIRCPYHRWGYGRDGTLVATPRFDETEIEGFDPKDFGLQPVSVDSFAGLIFVCLDPDVASLADWLGDLPQRLAGYDLDRWHTVEEAVFDIEANWKLIAENYQEYYHLQWVHPDLATVSRVADHYRYQGRGCWIGQTTTPVSSEERDDWLVLPPSAGLDASDAASGRFIWLFPNVGLSVLPNHCFVMLLQPVSPGRTIERGLWRLPAGSVANAAGVAKTVEFWSAVNAEDIDIVERGQRGLRAGGFTPGRLSPRFEEPLHRFHNLLADRFCGVERIPEGDPDDGRAMFGEGDNPLPWRPRAHS